MTDQNFHDRLKTKLRAWEYSYKARRDHYHGFDHQVADLAEVVEATVDEYVSLQLNERKCRMGGYSPKQIFKQEPAAIVSVVMGWIAVLVVTGVISWSTETTASVQTALTVTLLMLWVRPSTVSKDALNQLQNEQPPPPQG